MPTTTLSSSSSRSINSSSRKLRVSAAGGRRRDAMDRQHDSDDEDQHQQLSTQDEEKEWRELDERGGDESAKMVTDCEANYSSSNSSSSSHSGNARTPSSSSAMASRLVLLQYPSSSSSSHSSHSHAESNSQQQQQKRQQLVLLPPVPSGVVPDRTPLLFPVAVVPQQVPRATEIQLFLSRIECIEINSVVEREEGVVYYVLDVFRHRQQNGIPTRRRSSAPPPYYQPQQQQQQEQVVAENNINNKHNDQQLQLQRSGSSQAREPDYQIEHRYSSFARLRSNVWQIARKRHRRGRACSYCGSLVKFFVESDAQPNLKVKFTTTTEKRKEILSKFINDLLFATRDDHVECARSSRGYHQVPVLMKRFLNEQTGENFFS